MCPFIILLVIFQLFYLVCDVASVQINIKLPTNNSNEVKVKEGYQQKLDYVLGDFNSQSTLKINVRDPNVAYVDREFIELYQLSNTKTFNDTIVVNGKSVGFTKLDVIYYETKNPTNRTLLRTIDIVTIFDENEVLSTTFTVMVAVLVSLNIVNMGCAIDTQVIRETVLHPTAIWIGFFTHYFFMPFFAFFIGELLFKDVPYLRLSLFIFGCSPGGSAANMWTVLLGGNLNLSITLTFISTLAAVVMMPLWLFTLGLKVFETHSIKIPYRNILTSLFTLVICIGVGILIQKYRPKLAQRSKKILAPVCGFLIVFIVVFASICYWYLFKLMSWQIILASTLNVWLGFLMGALSAAILRQKMEDIISIAVETGIQNTGIVFIIIRLALEAPYRDYAMTIPIAGSCVTAIPLTVMFLVIKCRNRSKKKSDSNQEICDGETTPIRPKNVVEVD